MNPLDDWIAQLAAELGVDPGAIDRDQLLAVARDAAHAVARPAAPLTTYLVGLAAGLRGGGAEAAKRAAETALRLAATRSSSSADDQRRTGVDVHPAVADQPGEQ